MSIPKTTIIIGAGANKEINEGSGLGFDLIQGISERVTDRTSKGKGYLSKAFQILPHLNDHSVRESFLRHLDLFRFDNNHSLDAFIYEVENFPEYQPYRENFKDIARILTFAHVLGWEGHRIPDSHGRYGATFKNILNEVSKKRQKTWFSELASFISDKNLFNSDDLMIITFNYDRILEVFLLTFFNSNNEIKNFINNNIIHVYGRIGCLPELKPKNLTLNGTRQLEKEIEFGYDNGEFKKISEVRDNIYFIHDDISDRDVKNVMRKAEKLLVFGYGFDSLNNKRLLLGNSFIAAKSAFNIYGGTITQRRKTVQYVRDFARKANLKFLPPVEFVKWGLHEMAI
ncbi:hypothetical protein [Chryseolinea sp. H1M3-3]|uniref:hypothetical protein n=1 Tax=Chryseolinea sp. H1M3-3 TaxID=3034144 RepID=UPI0023EC3F4B|nr:hypothetical protein [Chryseolinea sp. H1M3-3]